MEHPLNVSRPSLPLGGGDARAIDVLREARDLGLENLPRSDERAPGGAQTLIVERFRSEQRELARRARSALDDLARRARDDDAIPVPESLSAHWDTAELRVKRLELESRDALVVARRDERRAFRQLAWFRRQNRLAREAEYPPSLLLQLGILLTLVLGESLANMYFFALGSDFGLLGGLIQALSISLVNVGLAVLVGIFALRNLHHVDGWRRGAAGLGFGLFVALALTLNLLVGHYRDLFTLDSEAALLQLLPRARTAPLELTPHSLLLLVIGLAAAALGLAKGYTLDDRYPGYGHADRRYREAEQRWLGLVAALRPRIFEALEQALRGCEQALGGARARVAQLSGAVLEMEDTARRFASGVEAIESECHRMLRAFREENAHVRTTPPPAYFEDYPRFETTLSLPPSADFERRVEKLRQQLQVLEAAVVEYRARIVKRIELEAQALDTFLNDVTAQVRNELQAET